MTVAATKTGFHNNLVKKINVAVFLDILSLKCKNNSDLF